MKSASATRLDDEIALRAEPLPTILWIELTSRCPFDCVFCSRQLLRGNGRHMDFGLYSGLIGQLRNPEIIRLNYSGESIHHPRLVESCRAAAETGAAVELVTALAALPEAKLEPLAMSGLGNMTVSLHTLDPDQFRQIYGFGSLDVMKHHIERLQALSQRAPRGLQIDFAFVAMQRNIDQLLPVVQYADRLGIARVCVHPVIRRDPIRETFSLELESGKLRPDFLALLQQHVGEARSRYPAVRLEVSTPELEDIAPLNGNPTYYPHPLPAGARIHGCDQDPWKTVHILSDGRVVSCEVRDQIVLGSLATESLAAIWHGETYRQFRRRHLLGTDEKCRNCVYKRAHLPEPAPRLIVPGAHGTAGLLAGWYNEEPGMVWSGRRGALRLMAEKGEALTLKLLMPPSLGRATQLSVDINGQNIARVTNEHPGQREVNLSHRFAEGGTIVVGLTVDATYRPSAHLDSPDSRELGVALMEARVGRE